MTATSALKDARDGSDANLLSRLLEEGARLRDAGNAIGALEVYREALALDPENPDAVRNFALVACRVGRFDEADSFIRRVFVQPPADRAYRSEIAALNLGVASIYASRNDVVRAIAHLRRAIECDPTSAEARVRLSNLTKQVGRRAELLDFAPDRTTEPVGHHILIACMPKSGSSFLNAVLRAVTGWSELLLSYAYLQNEQEIHLPYLLGHIGQNTVTQQHCRATDPNVQILEAFGIRPIVLVRNLFDVVLSLADFYDGSAVHNTFFPTRWGKFTAERKYDLIIDHIMPWYVTFFASWTDAMRARRLDCKLVTYDGMIADKPGTLAAILAHQGLKKSADECAAAIATVDGGAAPTRLNKGVGGRGIAALSETQKDRIRRLAGHYPDIDYSIVGL